MRVAYVCADPGVPTFGAKGCSIHVQEVMKALIRAGGTVELFATSTGAAPPEGLERVRVHALPKPTGTLAERERASQAANVALGAALAAAGPFDLVYERYSLWSFAAIESARAHGTPAVLEVNAPLIEEQAAYRGLVDREAAERTAARVFSAATVIAAVSRPVAEYVARGQRDCERIHVVPNGVDPARFVAPRPDRAPGPFTVGFVGSLKPWHGVETLVQAFTMLRRQHPDTRLLIVGDGPGRAALGARLRAEGLDGVTRLTGAVPAQEVPHWLTQMDVAVAPYPDLREFYFSPLKVYEYMAAGLPVVASRIGQLAELIRDEVDGLLCPAGDASAFACALDRLHGTPALRRRLGRAGRAAVLRHHTWDQSVARILALAGCGARPVPGVAS